MKSESIICTKCGSSTIRKKYLENIDEIEIVCGECDFKWHVIPNDKKEVNENINNKGLLLG
ncbi:MAG: hypothetical protein ACOC2U_01705 [bacterium]